MKSMSISRLRFIPAIEEYYPLRLFCQRAEGKVLLLLAFALGLHWHGVSWWPAATLVLGSISFWPEHRTFLVGLSGVYWLAIHSLWPHWLLRELARLDGLAISQQNLRILQASLPMLALALCISATHVLRSSALLGRRPVRNLLLAYGLILGGTSYGLRGSHWEPMAWGLAALLGQYIWLAAYIVSDPVKTGNLLRAWVLPPFWSSWTWDPTLPIPNGPAILRRIEAAGSEQAAVYQLKGLKLLYWALMLKLLQSFLMGFWYGLGPMAGIKSWMPNWDVVPFWKACLMASLGTPLPWYSNWVSLLCRYFLVLLELSISSHLIVALIRMSGYYALRNVHRPLTSPTIAEYWGRAGYYVKELLATLFFYPAFFRYFKRRPLLRLSFAIFAAAGFGNFLAVYFIQWERIALLGLWQTFCQMQSYLIYCMLLASGIICSRLRRQIWPGEIKPNIGSIIWVNVFYCMISVFNDYREFRPLRQSFRMFLGLFGIG
ncbi:MAG: hypothetical protein A3J74_00125 [Elusimicrobia bacterium RIFCSPHIGHO2_02_FULL_57_9]|nr:MAG: hypothetical protein A3J74_00125 [Elusimicrobia bacterium RIFCSPHIGHO2_02_FULL_57_9]